MLKKINLLLFSLCISLLVSSANALGTVDDTLVKENIEEEELNIKELILDHLADTYEWHIFTWNDNPITIPRIRGITYSRL